MGLFSRRSAEQRSVSFQDVWGSGEDLVKATSDADALKLSIVVACVNLRANLLSQLPWDAYVTVDGRLQIMDVQPAVIESPSMLPRSQWLKQMSISRDIWGNAFGTMDGARVEWLNPAQVTVLEDDPARGRLRLSYRGRQMDRRSMVIVPGMPTPGKHLGVAPLSSSGLVDLAVKAQTFGSDWFQNGAMPSGVITSDEELSSEQARDIKAAVKRSWRNRQVGVLGSGLKFDPVDQDADSTQFLSTLRHIQLDICQTFGVPPEKVGVAVPGSSVTYQNREASVQQFLQDTMNSELVLIQEILSGLLPAGQTVRANTGALLRADLKTRFDSYATGLQHGFMDVDQVRTLEDWMPFDGDRGGSDDVDAARNLVEMVQKVYLGVGKVVTESEARGMLNSAGAGLDVGVQVAPPESEVELTDDDD